ncbi:MAG: 4Fe-4S ferredoxin [Rhodospirillales bacterium]|nr:MAG: 4Fe-4S ferredoxin [Rhodospirillales bacterium]
MTTLNKRLLLCSCDHTMPLDGKAVAAPLGIAPPDVLSRLCTAQLGDFRQAASSGEPLLVGCTQEAPLFAEIAAEAGSGIETAITTVNIRERAGWSDDGAQAAAKIAALLAEAALDLEPTPALTLKSDGVALVYGRDDTALAAARRLADRLEVRCFLLPPGNILPPSVADVPVFCGRIRTATGHLGAFRLTIDGHGPRDPSSRAALRYGPQRDGVEITADIIVDLSGDPPLFPAAAGRDGYLRAEPSDPVQVERLLFDAADLVGSFEKPRYVRLDPSICAHARNRIVGCTNCLDVCPTGALVPDGDAVRIDPFFCIGHGACASTCPTGAIAYDLPRGHSVFKRLRVLLATYHRAAGRAPVLLVHDRGFGWDRIALLARTGPGLPAHVLPFAVNEVTQLGLDFLLTSVAYGVAQVRVLVPPQHRTEALAPLRRHAEVVATVTAGLGYAGPRLVLDEGDDPTDLGTALRAAPPPSPIAKPARHLVMGDKRTTERMALAALHGSAPRPVAAITLPQGAPFGQVVLDQARCTLCLACAGACPTRALGGNPDWPQLHFTESICVQCGLCQATCPEDAITLAPLLSFAGEAAQAITLKEETPFHCIRCGKPFATQSGIDRLVDRLAGHPMFPTPDRLAILRMCEDCRIIVQSDDEEAPLAGWPRPRPRTTEDYLRARNAAGSEDGEGA